MSKIRYHGWGGPKGRDFQARTVGDRPPNPNAGDVFTESGRKLVFTGRDWAWFPDTATELLKFARRFGWGVKIDIGATHREAGRNLEGDKIVHTDVRIVMLIGREPGPTSNGRQSKGYLYRLVWDTSRFGIFELVSWYRRTSTDPRWVQPGTIAEIRPIIARHPVLPERAETHV